MGDIVRAYFMRHGCTDMSPRPEDWLPIPLNAAGRRKAREGAKALKRTMGSQKADSIVSSDLLRAAQTADIAGEVLRLPTMQTMEDLRAFNPKFEGATDYEERTAAGLDKIFAGGGRPLIVGHRSTTTFLDKRYGQHKGDPEWGPDYHSYSLLHEGGVLAVTDSGLTPVHLPNLDHWPIQLATASLWYAG